MSQTKCGTKWKSTILTSKFIEIGGLAHFFLSLVGSSSISALIWDSFIPAIRLILQKIKDTKLVFHVYVRHELLHIMSEQWGYVKRKLSFTANYSIRASTHFQTMAFSLALYLAFPFMQITCTPLVLRGVGIRTWGHKFPKHCSVTESDLTHARWKPKVRGSGFKIVKVW